MIDGIDGIGKIFERRKPQVARSTSVALFILIGLQF